MARRSGSAAVAVALLSLGGACAGAVAPPQRLLGAELGDDLGFGHVVDASADRLVVRGSAPRSSADPSVSSVLEGLGFTVRPCVGPGRACLRYHRGDEIIEGTFASGPTATREIVLRRAAPYTPRPIPAGAPWDDLRTEIGAALFAERRRCSGEDLDEMIGDGPLTFTPDGAVAGSFDGEGHAFAGTWTFAEQRLQIRGRWTPAVLEPDYSCRGEGEDRMCGFYEAHEVTDDSAVLEIHGVWFREGAAWIRATPLPSRNEVLLTCDVPHYGGDILVIDGGGGAAAVAAVGQVIASVHDPATLVRTGPPAEHPRHDVEILPRADGRWGTDKIQAALERDIPAIRTSRRTWPEAPADVVVVVGPVTLP